MLQLTKRTEYGLIALVHLMDQRDLAVHSDAVFVSAREIGERYPVPRRLLAEVLKDLARAELVLSARGATGGYSLAHPPEDISLGEIVTALEGRPTLTGCEAPAGDHACEVESVCPIKSPMTRVRNGLWALLDQTSLRDLGSEPVALSHDFPASAGAPRALGETSS